MPPAKYKKGFTLLELMVVTSIISLLSSSMLAGYSTVAKKSRDSQRTQIALQIKNGLELYAVDHHGTYPPAPQNPPGILYGNWYYTECFWINTYNPSKDYCWGGSPVDGAVQAPGDPNLDNALKPYMAIPASDPFRSTEAVNLGSGFLYTTDANSDSYELQWGTEACYVVPGTTIYKSPICGGGDLTDWGDYKSTWLSSGCGNHCVMYSP